MVENYAILNPESHSTVHFFVFLSPHPLSVPFHVKEKQQELEKEKMEVKNLDHWKPAPTLLQSLVPGGARRVTLPQL